MSTTHTYPAYGWLPQGAHVQWQRDDQGKDFVTNWAGVIQAPGSGYCVHNLSDKPFPNGFGPRYPVVMIQTGAFAGHMFYIGHCTSLVSDGEHFGFGHPLARADQGHPSSIGVNAPFNGGWVELGEAPNGFPGAVSPSHWFDSLLFKNLTITVPDPPLKFGDKGWKVLSMSALLRDCGWLNRPWFHFNSTVHGAVVAFQEYHHLHVDGIVGPQTQHTLETTAAYCRKHHIKEHHLPPGHI